MPRQRRKQQQRSRQRQQPEADRVIRRGTSAGRGKLSTEAVAASSVSQAANLIRSKGKGLQAETANRSRDRESRKTQWAVGTDSMQRQQSL